MNFRRSEDEIIIRGTIFWTYSNILAIKELEKSEKKKRKKGSRENNN